MTAADKPNPSRKRLKKYQDFYQHSALSQPETTDLPPLLRGLSRQVNRKARNNHSLQYDCSLQANSQTLPCQTPNALLPQFRFPRGRSKARRNGRGHIRGGPGYGFFLKKELDNPGQIQMRGIFREDRSQNNFTLPQGSPGGTSSAGDCGRVPGTGAP